MARLLRPLMQGDLDGLCGLYSLLNADSGHCIPAVEAARGRDASRNFYRMPNSRPCSTR